MKLLATLIVAVLLSGSASVASGSVFTHVKRSSRLPRTTVPSEATITPANELLASSSSISSSSSGAASSPDPDITDWVTFCDSQPHTKCVVLFMSATLVFLVLFTLLCAWCLVRWWKCKLSGRRVFRRLRTIDDDNANIQEGSNDDRRYAETVVERERLLNADCASTGANHEEETEEGERVADAPTRRTGRRLHLLNVHGTLLWTALRVAPASLFYSSGSQLSSPSQVTRAPRTQHAFSAPPSEAAVPQHAREENGRQDAWQMRRDMLDAPSTAAGCRPFLRGIVSVATTTADSSERGNDDSQQSDDSDAAHDEHRFVCERGCSKEVVAETVEDECPVRRSAVIASLNNLITPHALPQLFNYSARSTTVHDEENCNIGFVDGTDSNRQQISHPHNKSARTSTSSLTSSADSSTVHTLSFLAREAVSKLAPHTECSESVFHYEASEHDANDKCNSEIRVGSTHVKTTIFDTSTNACVAMAPPGVGLSMVNDLFEPDHFPPSSHPASEAPVSSAATHMGVLDCYTSPPATSGMATTAALRERLSLCLPLPISSITATSRSAALPVSKSLNDGLDMEGEEIVEEFDLTQQSRSYVPATQQHYQQRLQQQQTQSPPQQNPAPLLEEPGKARRKRSISQYSEPWQPILVPRSSPQLAAAVAVTVPPTPTTSTTTTTTGVTAAQWRNSLCPPCSLPAELSGTLEGELDDLMLEDDESAQSNETGVSGHIFSGSSTSTSRTITPATENDPESGNGTSTLLCVPATANGSNGVNGTISGFVTVIPPASASIPVLPEPQPTTIFARTAVVGVTLLGGCGIASNERTLSSCGVCRRPLNLSVEERTLLMKSRKWLFPLIDGVDEIESGGLNESPRGGVKEEEVVADRTES